MADEYVNHLLWRWGQSRTSEHLGYPKQCPAFREYRPKGFRETRTPTNWDDVDKVGRIIDTKLSRTHTEILKCRFRYKLKIKDSCKRLGIDREMYKNAFEWAVAQVERRFNEE